MSAPVPCPPARGRGPSLSPFLAICARLHLSGLPCVGLYVQNKRGPLWWVALWLVVSPSEGLRTEKRQGARASFRISLCLGRWFQSCGPLGLRYNRGSRGLWPRCGSYSGTLSVCVSSPWCGRFIRLLRYYGGRFQSSALGRSAMPQKRSYNCKILSYIRGPPPVPSVACIGSPRGSCLRLVLRRLGKGL